MTFDLNKRVPENKQYEENIDEYLEVCSNVFNEIKDTIKKHDWYKDYRNIPEKRLSLLAYRFNYRESPLLTEEITRGIIRDITHIYTTNGTRGALYWVFRLLGWKVKVENAWLLNPQNYFNGLIPDSPEYPTGEGVYLKFRSKEEVTNDSILDYVAFGEGYNIEVQGQEYHNNAVYAIESYTYLKVGENNNFLGEISSARPTYHIEEEDQFYIPNPELIIYGYPLIGLNFAEQASKNQREDISTTRERSFDYNKLNYRNFVYGRAVDDSNGTYFYGRTYDSIEENLEKVRIVGEEYDPQVAWHSNNWVMSTPYLAITLTEEDYSKFVREYEYNGQEYVYNESEEKTLIEYLINYVFYELIRPSPVKILVLGEHVNMRDTGKVIEQVYEDTWTADPYPEELDDPLYVRELSFLQTNINLEPPTISLAPQCSPTAINVSFTANSDAQGVRIYRDTTPVGDWSAKPKVYEEMITSGIFQDTDISPDQGYWYMVEVFFTDIDVDSEIKGSLAECVYSPPNASLSQACNPVPTVTISFSDTSGNSLGTKIYRSETDSGWDTQTPIHTTSSASGSYDDTDVVNGTTYYYRTEADYGGENLQSATQTITINCSADPTLSVSFACGSSSSSVSATYEVNDTSFSDVTIYESNDSLSGPWTQVYTSTSSFNGQYVETDAVSGTTYYYKLEATRISDGTVYSTVASTTPECLDSAIYHMVQFTATPSDYKVETLNQVSHQDSNYSRGSVKQVLIGENTFYLI